MSDTGVPEDQVPRDEKFWNTYHAVQEERAVVFARLRCDDKGHVIVTTSRKSVPAKCKNCDLTGDELFIDAGYRKVGSKWV